jgi:hypothetical protein
MAKITDKLIIIFSKNKHSTTTFNTETLSKFDDGNKLNPVNCENIKKHETQVILTDNFNIQFTNFELDSKKINPEELENHDVIIFGYIDQNEQFQYLASRISPEPEYNWLSVCDTFVQNFYNEGVDKNGYYKWSNRNRKR